MKKLLIIIMFFLMIKNLNALENISVSKEEIYPLFNKDIHTYNVYVSKDTQIITISATSEENEIVTNTGSKSLINGLNTFEIISYKNDIQSVYKINIVRGEEIIDKTNAFLRYFNIENYDIDFDKNVFNYSINIEEETILNVQYKAENEKAKVLLKEDLTKENGYIKLEVISEDKSKTNIYIVNVYKKIIEKDKKIKTSLFDKANLTEDKLFIIRSIIIAVLVLIIIILFYFIVIKKRTNNILYIKHSILHKLFSRRK